MSDENAKLTEEQAAAELQSRVKGFNEKLIPLLGEFKLGLSASAFLTTDGRIGARPSLIDDTPVEKKPEATEEKKDEGSAVTAA